jgi:hypothetical protein
VSGSGDCCEAVGGVEDFPAVGGLLVFAEHRHEYERAGDVDFGNIDVPVLMRGSG